MGYDERAIKDMLRRLEELESRVKRLESQLKPSAEISKSVKVDEYKGLSGGINLTIKNSFFDTPKTVVEIQKELERLGYYHPRGAIDTALRRDFMKGKQFLTRIRKDDKWHYVLRK